MWGGPYIKFRDTLFCDCAARDIAGMVVPKATFEMDKLKPPPPAHKALSFWGTPMVRSSAATSGMSLA
jgi:hypothetical protein